MRLLCTLGHWALIGLVAPVLWYLDAAAVLLMVLVSRIEFENC